MNKWLLALVLVVVVGGGYFLMKGQTPSVPSESMQPTTEQGSTGASALVTEKPATGASGAMMEKGEVKEFTLDSFEFGYDQKILTVKKGDTVKIILTNSGKMMHDWVVDEFSARTKQITNGKTDSVTFVADKAGTFEFYCSVGKHRANGMVGKLVVQ